MAVRTPATLADLQEQYRARTPKSARLFARATGGLPGGSTRTSTYFDPYPPYIERGAGSRITDVDGNAYVDVLNNYTSLILGHAHPEVVAAAVEQIRIGSAFGAPTQVEVDLADEIRSRVPSAEEIRFTNSGTEATMLALRIARAATGRSAIAKFERAYHGTHDWALAGTRGVPAAVTDLVIELPFGDIDGVRERLAGRASDLAAIIIEPIQGAGLRAASREFLGFLRDLTTAHGIVLIFDEIIAFRVGYHGAQGESGVTPDLTTFGKIVGGGYPLAAVGGRRALLELLDARRTDGLVHGGTFNGNPVAAAAGLATLRHMTPARFRELNERGERLRTLVRTRFLAEGLDATVSGTGSLVQFTLPTPDALQRFHLALLLEGFYLAHRGLGALSTAISEAELYGFGAAAVRSAALALATDQA